MKFTCDLQLLENYVAFAVSHTNPGSLNKFNRLLNINVGHGIEFRACSGVTYGVAVLEIETEGAGGILVDPQLFTKVLATLNPGKVKFELDGNTLNISQGRKRRSVATINSENFSLMPNIDTQKSFEIEANDMLGYIGLVDFAKANTRDRPILQGVYLTSKAAYAADGSRVAAIPINNVEGSIVFAPEIGDCLKSMLPLLENSKLVVEYGDEGWVKLSNNNIAVYAAQLMGDFPPVGDILTNMETQKSEATLIKFSRSSWLPTIQLAEVYSNLASINQEDRELTLEVTDGLRFKFDSSLGGIDDIVEGEIEGDAVNIKVLPHLLTQLLQASPTEELELYIWAPFRPMLFESKEYNWRVIQTPMATKEEHEQWQKVRQELVEEEEESDF